MIDPIHIEMAVVITAIPLVSVGAAYLIRRAGLGFSLSARRAFALCLLSCIIYAAVFSFLTLKRYEAYNAGMLDFGGMDQAIWNTQKGRFLEVTSLEWGQTRRLAAHVEPSFALFSPVYLLWDDPRALLLLQTLLVAFGAVPVYLFARRQTGGNGTALALSLAYLLNPSLHFANRSDFHGDTVAVIFVLGAIYFFASGRMLWFWIFAVIAMG
ncbi:DUF2079 domain-containing protein, partial [Acidobacteriota bacterium]